MIWTCVADAGRPRYGGTLRVETAAAMRSLNPASVPLDASDALARRWLHPLIFETLVAPDPRGGLRAVLAMRWENEADDTRWRFHLRPAIRLHDGSTLDGDRVAAVLRPQAKANAWTITSDLRSVTIQTQRGEPDLPWQLTDIRYGIAFGRPGGGEPIGTGPFAIERWEPKRLRLRAHDDHWGGRPFLDAIQVEMGRLPADQASSVDLGRADFVSLEPHRVRPPTMSGSRVIATKPIELVALVFESSRGTPPPARRALSLAIDRAAMCNVLLHGYAQPASRLLPDWLSGYASLVPADHDPSAARDSLRDVAPAQRSMTLSVPSSDAVLRAIGERIAVDAREVGLSITVGPAGVAPPTAAKARLVRARLQPTARELALAAAAATLGLPGTLVANDANAAYRFEREAIESGAIVPVLHLAEVYAISPAMESWLSPVVLTTGRWNLENVWLRDQTR